VNPTEDSQIVPVDGTLDRVSLSQKMASVRRGERRQVTVLPAKNVEVFGGKRPRRAIARVIDWILTNKVFLGEFRLGRRSAGNSHL
jgi:hypothetical protein